MIDQSSPEATIPFWGAANAGVGLRMSAGSTMAVATAIGRAREDRRVLTVLRVRQGTTNNGRALVLEERRRRRPCAGAGGWVPGVGTDERLWIRYVRPGAINRLVTRF
ncbi:hypothetical protein GCM10009758_27940 [Microbacterium hatanonis]